MLAVRSAPNAFSNCRCACTHPLTRAPLDRSLRLLSVAVRTSRPETRDAPERRYGSHLSGSDQASGETQASP